MNAIYETNQTETCDSTNGLVEALARIAVRISADLDLEHVLKTIVDSARQLIQADLSLIALPDEAGDLHVSAITGNRSDAMRNLTIPAGVGMGGYVMRTGRAMIEPAYLSNIAIEHAPHVDQAVQSERLSCGVALPIRNGDQIAGVLWAGLRGTGRRFSDTQVKLLEYLAALAGAAIENARLLAREQQARGEAEALLDATASLGFQADPEEVLQTLVEKAADFLDAERAVYMLRADDHGRIPAIWANGIWTGEEIAISLDGGIHGLIWKSGKPYRSNDVAADPNSNPETRTRLGFRSLLGVPLLGPDPEPLGLIFLGNSRKPGGFSERDERLLAAICEYGSAVLRRANDTAARLAAEHVAALRNREVEGLLTAAARLNAAFEPDDVLLRVVEVAGDLLGASRVSILTNEGDHFLIWRSWDDGAWKDAGARIPVDRSVSGWVVENGRAYRSADIEHEHRFRWRVLDQPSGSMLAVPVRRGDGYITAVLTLFKRREQQPFSDEDQLLAEGIAHHAAVALDRANLLQQLRRSEEKLRRQAFSDSLTGLPNRLLFMDRVRHALAASRRHSSRVAILFLDLDGFKLINDSLGHAAGDELLVAVGNRLERAIRPADTIARFGGDEFVVLLEDIHLASDAFGAAERMLNGLRQPFMIHDRERFMTASVGIALSPPSNEEIGQERLLREADVALYQAKLNGKARAVLYEPSMSARIVERVSLESDLRRALERGELLLAYQPIIALETDQVVGVEALLRWQHPERGLLAARDFIRPAEDTGLILPIGEWVLREACQQAQMWTCPGGTPLPTIAVNLSARQFQQPDLVACVEATLQASGLPPARLEIEITESAIMQDVESAIDMMHALHDIGVRLAIDDFGTGYSSLSYLRRFAVDSLKLDQSFISDIDRDPATNAIVTAVAGLARTLGLKVTAEGIETASQLMKVRASRCDNGQGYYFSHPLSGETARHLIASGAHQIHS